MESVPSGKAQLQGEDLFTPALLCQRRGKTVQEWASKAFPCGVAMPLGTVNSERSREGAKVRRLGHKR